MGASNSRDASRMTNHDMDVWTSKFLSLHRQIENPYYFIFLRQHYILQDGRFKVILDCSYKILPRGLRKRLPQDIFEDVQDYNIRIKNDCATNA